MKKFLSEFKEFAVKGNALEMAVGVIIGAAFKSIVDSIVNDIIMPFVGILLGGKDFSALSIMVGNAKIKYGMLIQNIVNFLIVAFCLFLLVKTANKIRDGFSHKEEEEPKEEEPRKSEEVELLEQIRDSLKELGSK